MNCPHLPQPDAVMSHRCLTELKDADRATFYYTALKYGHYLWHQGHAGRAILAITRALYADVPETHPILKRWPLPYAALKWIAAHHHCDDFPGNPRISFQHQATRLRGHREALRRTRAWATWALICKARPTLTGDSAQGITEPSFQRITTQLEALGHPDEATLWHSALAND